jgi:ABC-2 type transport system ATP-binding protein
VLSVEDLRRSYRPPSGILRLLARSASDDTVVALDGVSMTAQAGRVFGLVGPNGAGKSTLIRIVSGLVDPDAGRVLVDGHDPTVDRRGASRALGVVLADDRSVYWRLTGRQNLEFHGALYGMSRAAAAKRAGELLEQFDLASRDRRVFGYSTGMRARLGIARALMHDPPVVVLDEPTRSLDPVAARRTCAMLRDIAAEGRTVLLSSHRLEELERTADDVAVLIRGRVSYVGTMASLHTEGTTVAVQLEEMLAADQYEADDD